MSRTKPRILSLSALVLLAAALPPAYAQDAPPHVPTTTPATTAPAAPTGQSKTIVPATKDAPKSKTAKPSKRPLDLAAPDISTLVSPDELKEPLPDQEQQAQAEEAETVAVKAQEDSPYVLGGFGALWWAMKHPTEAWRIITPVE